MNFDEVLAQAALAEHTERVCLNARLLGELEEAERLASTAETASAARVERKAETAAGRGGVRKLREAADAVRKAVDEQAVSLTFRALPFSAYNALIVKHPPRKDTASDKAYGFNVETLFPAMVRTCLVSPEVNDEQWERLLSVVNDRTWDRIARAALHVNRGEDAADIPFSSPDSERTRG